MDPELKAHQEWLGYLQPVGLVVAPAAMQDAGWVVTRSGSELIERQARYRAALEPLDDTADLDDSDTEQGFRSLLDLLTEHLGWDDDQLDQSPETIQAHTKELPELGDTLMPTAVVPAANGEGAQLLVVELPLAAAFDQKSSDADHLWRASAQERLERLLRETGVEAGLLFNGSQLRLVVAPKGESSGHLTFRLSELAEVSGRLMLSGLDLLLGQSHVFLDPDGYRLSDVLKKSRSFQAVVSNALADQVLAALWDLLRGFQQADELSQQQDDPLLGDLPERDPQQLYGGLITMLMRLVFLLYAEDEALMPSDAVYEQNYKLSAIFEQLQQDESEYPDTMEQRFGAWAGLMSLCRLVFDGGGPTVDYLPARHGQLFDPDVYPWLESPWISDGVVLAVLRNLLIVQGERISYRALDVEQIGSVYEGIMGYAVQRIPGRCIGLKSKPQGAKKQITTAVDLDALLEMPGANRKKWLDDEAGTTLPPKSASALKTADSEDALVEALAPRINRELFDGPQAAGSLVFQPTEERRRSGSHYTPRSLTRPIVEEALRPWMERCEYKPTAAQILDLKICDPAMGSGAFLVESCRYLAELLEQAWTREGLPEPLKPGGHALGEEPLIYARRLIAQSCLYGVDKNPFAVNLARLSLWLVSLSKDAPFTFVDHALKCGDSLVGMERSEIEAALKGASLQRELQINYIEEVKQQEAKSFALFHADSRSDADDEQKRKALEEWNASTAYLRTVGDLLVAAFFNGKKPKDRDQLKQIYLEATLQNSTAEALEDALEEPLERLREGDQGVQPLHWQLAFPDVFGRSNPGFDVVVGNPPFLGGRKISTFNGLGYFSYLLDSFFPAGNTCDLCAYFLRKSYEVLRSEGAFGIIGTQTISRGESREGGLSQIRDSGGWIYSAKPSIAWPGIASVIISVVHACKNYKAVRPRIMGQQVDLVTAFLFPSGPDHSPKQINNTGDHVSLGSYIYGSGFLFDDCDDAANPLSEMHRIKEASSAEGARILPYIGGNEFNSSPSHDPSRYVLFLSDIKDEDGLNEFPILKSVVEEKVKPLRLSLGDNPVNKPLKRKWWAYQAHRPAFYAQTKGLGRLIASSKTSSNLSFDFVENGSIYSDKLMLFGYDSSGLLAMLSSQMHEIWVSSFCPKQGAGYSYTIADGFASFPFSADFLDLSALDDAGDIFYEARKSIMRKESVGLSKLYRLFHDPSSEKSYVHQLRKLHQELDAAALEFYGWDDIIACRGFLSSQLEIENEYSIPGRVMSKISAGRIFCIDQQEALEVESLLRSGDALVDAEKISWRYQCSDEIRDEILSRLLSLNSELSAENLADETKSRSNKSVAVPTSRKSAKSVKARGSKSSEQLGLGL